MKFSTFLIVPMFSVLMLSCTPAVVPIAIKDANDALKTYACISASIDGGTPTFKGVALDCGVLVVQDVVDVAETMLLAYQRKPDAGLGFVPSTHMRNALLALHY